MACLNRVVLMGNLTKDPETKKLKTGTVADLRMALSESYKSKSGEQVDNVCYVDVVAWDKQAENCAQYLSKGSGLVVEGRIQMDEWEKDGQKRSKLRVRANRVTFLGDKKAALATAEPPF